jgi:hypothetical protein
MSIPLFQKEDETEEAFKIRIFERVAEWVPLVTEAEIPKSGPVRAVWNNVNRIQALSDEELSDQMWDARHSDDLISNRWWGTVCRAWCTLLTLEHSRRSGRK